MEGVGCSQFVKAYHRGKQKLVEPMSAIGTKRTSLVAPHMSAFEGKADMASASQNVRL